MPAFDGVTVTKLFSQPPSRTPIDLPLADIVSEAVGYGFGKRPVRVPSLAGTTPDYVFTKLLGVPSIMLPFAPADENHHAPNESMKISLFLAGTRASARIIGDLAERSTR